MAWGDATFLTANDAKGRLGLMPAALDRIYRIFQNFAWDEYSILTTKEAEIMQKSETDRRQANNDALTDLDDLKSEFSL